MVDPPTYCNFAKYRIAYRIHIEVISTKTYLPILYYRQIQYSAVYCKIIITIFLNFTFYVSCHIFTNFFFFCCCFEGVKVDKTKIRKVCFDCLEDAEESQFRMVERLMKNQLVIEEALPIPRESTVTLDDSDQVCHQYSRTCVRYTMFFNIKL